MRSAEIGMPGAIVTANRHRQTQEAHTKRILTDKNMDSNTARHRDTESDCVGMTSYDITIIG